MGMGERGEVKKKKKRVLWSLYVSVIFVVCDRGYCVWLVCCVYVGEC